MRLNARSGFEELLDSLDVDVGNGDRLFPETHDRHYTGAGKNRKKAFTRVQPTKYIAREQGSLDFYHSVGPAPTRFVDRHICCICLTRKHVRGNFLAVRSGSNAIPRGRRRGFRGFIHNIVALKTIPCGFLGCVKTGCRPFAHIAALLILQT
jgi:hypothetical protein